MGNGGAGERETVHNATTRGANGARYNIFLPTLEHDVQYYFIFKKVKGTDTPQKAFSGAVDPA